jgi:protein SCO1
MTSSRFDPATRRGWVSSLVAVGAAGLSAAAAAGQAGLAAARSAPGRTPDELASERLRQRRTPNVPLLDHNGRSLRFYDDVMKNRIVVLNVMYTVCSNICTPATRHLLEARSLLGAAAKDLHFVSMTLTPLTDTPAALREYKTLHGIDEGWTFLTGKVEDVERVQRGLGFISDRDSDDLLSHSAMARVCDERNQRWAHVNTLLSPRSIARMIRFELV